MGSYKKIKLCILLLSFCWLLGLCCIAQKNTSINDPAAGEVLDRVAKKYQAGAWDIDFALTTVRPKLKPEEADAKYTSTDNGKITLKGNKFHIAFSGHEIFCDGKNIWSYAAEAREVQLNEYEESEEIFSPSKIFTLYKDGYSYQIKEKKNFQGKAVTVIELVPTNRKVSFFKIDVAVDDATGNVIESKLYEKSGTRYIYKINRHTLASPADSDFTFDSKKYPGVKVVDLR